VLYLRGVLTSDFQEALAALLGKDAPNLSLSVIARLKGDRQTDHDRWQKRNLSARRYVYVWADGVYLQARLELQAECMLVLLGARRRARPNLNSRLPAFRVRPLISLGFSAVSSRPEQKCSAMSR
jgi:hypothetical protein